MRGARIDEHAERSGDPHAIEHGLVRAHDEAVGRPPEARARERVVDRALDFVDGPHRSATMHRQRPTAQVISAVPLWNTKDERCPVLDSVRPTEESDIAP